MVEAEASAVDRAGAIRQLAEPRCFPFLRGVFTLLIKLPEVQKSDKLPTRTSNRKILDKSVGAI